ISIIKFNFMAYIAVGSILILTLTGLDRLIPRFSLPSEPEVSLIEDDEEIELNNEIEEIA
ncbi:MAG: Na+/H+ antiporter NhaC family protein, partial [Cetobacterium sp.]